MVEFHRINFCNLLNICDNDVVSNQPHPLEKGFYGPLQLCHGDLGSLDIALKAYQLGFVSEKKYHGLWQHVVNKLTSLGDYYIDGNMPGFSTSLMTGHAGIAYQLLRCLHPDKVPSILTTEMII